LVRRPSDRSFSYYLRNGACFTAAPFFDGLHGGFLTTDENGQRLFALTTSGLAIVQLAGIPLGIGTLSPSAES